MTITFPDEENSSPVFSYQSEVSLLWNYVETQSPQAKTCARLTRLAGRKHWSPHDDIDWSPDVVGNKFPCKREADPFCGFYLYDRLPKTERLRISWQRHSMEISEILHGEQLALLCASQLISLMPCMESRLFASTQAADEARHVEFFRHYLASFGMQICPPSLCLKQLAIETLQSPRWETKLLVCQVLIESLALAQFSWMIEKHDSPSLQVGLRRIMNDEARHVKFGTDYLKFLFIDHHPDQLSNYGNFVINKAFELASSDNYGLAIASERRWDTHKFRQHLRQHRINNPELFRQRFRQLSLNIKSTGLMDSDVEHRLKRFVGT